MNLPNGVFLQARPVGFSNMASMLGYCGLQPSNAQKYSLLEAALPPNEASSSCSSASSSGRAAYEDSSRQINQIPAKRSLLFKRQCCASTMREPNINLQLKSSKQNGYSLSSNGSCFAPKDRVAIVWFKKDLRIDDHPGLLAASSYKSVVPLYIFDPEILAGWPIHLLEALLKALMDLRHVLRGIGSDLIIRKGRIVDELLTMSHEVGASDIITEQEVEHEWGDCLQMDFHEGEEINIKFWTGFLYELEYRDLPSSYREFQKLQSPVNLPLEAPTSLPILPSNLHKGILPSIVELGEDIGKSFMMNRWQESFKSIKKEAEDNLIDLAGGRRDGLRGGLNCWLGGPFEGFLAWRERYILSSPYEAFEKRKKELMTSLDKAGRRDFHMVGTSAAIDALNGYFRFLDPTLRDDWKQLYDQVIKAEAKHGSSFRSLFGTALTLGSLSRRRVYYEALEYEKAHCGSWLFPCTSSFTSAAALNEIKSMEWYRMLAMVTVDEGRSKGLHVHYWNWRGFLIQYSMSGSEGPCIVLVHGFGGFGEHYRDNIKGLAEKQTRVWALTMLGFGRSEKPNVLYTELLWAELIRDFIVEVVREPVVLVGNSIGGYMVSSVAGHWPSIVKSLILLNTAGNVIPDYFSVKYLEPREKSGLAWAGGWLLLLSLRIFSSGLLKKCYPVRPWRADKWLFGEIIRASYDPGALAVLQSLLHLKRPLPINYFIDRYNSKVLVIQGVKDPLKRVIDRVRMLKSHCQNVVVKFMDAGHCPHDEFPNEVNTIIIDWIQKIGLLQDEPCKILESRVLNLKLH